MRLLDALSKLTTGVYSPAALAHSTEAEAEFREVKQRRKPPPAKTLSGLPIDTRTRGDKVIEFIESYVVVPEGKRIGLLMELEPEQKEFIRRIYDRVDGDAGLRLTRTGIFSAPRKNGKTGLIAALVLAHLIGPEAKYNSQIVSAARSREQASQVHRYASRSLRMNPELDGLYHVVEGTKRIWGLEYNVEYVAVSKDAKNAYGKSPMVVIHDELGQVVDETDSLFEALETSGGAHEEFLSLIISTQAPSDTALLSRLIDDGLANPDGDTVVMLFSVPDDGDVFDMDALLKANFACRSYRSIPELRTAMNKAKRMPSLEAAFRNLYANQRISTEALFMPPSIWRELGMLDCDDSIFTSGAEVAIGLDLSTLHDLTSVALTCEERGEDGERLRIHCKVFNFLPDYGIDEKSKRDRVNYREMARRGYLHLFPGKTQNFKAIIEFLKPELEGMNLTRLYYDRWRIADFRRAADEAGGFCEEADWFPVGQGFKDMTVRLESFEQQALAGLIAHGNNPLLNTAATKAVAIFDPARNRKLDKNKSNARIDPMVALVMSAYAWTDGTPGEEDTSVTEDSIHVV